MWKLRWFRASSWKRNEFPFNGSRIPKVSHWTFPPSMQLMLCFILCHLRSLSFVFFLRKLFANACKNNFPSASCLHTKVKYIEIPSGSLERNHILGRLLHLIIMSGGINYRSWRTFIKWELKFCARVFLAPPRWWWHAKRCKKLKQKWKYFE